MSKIIASAAIRGAHKLVARAEEALRRALETFGPETPVAFPNTGYYLPVIYGMTGMPVTKLEDLKPVLEKAKELLPPVPSERCWLPYLGPALDAGMATLFADEIIEATKYVGGEPPYTMTSAPTPDNLWLGAADDVILRKRGIEFVDGTAPGFAAIVGAAPTNEIAVKIARELQEKNLYVFMSAETDGRNIAEQLAEEGVELGWETRLVPFGKDITATVFSLGFAARAAMSFGGVKPGDYRRVLLYNKNRIFAFVLALGHVDDEKYAQAAGAINFGFPTIADTDIPEILPTGVCTYEHVVSNVPHDKIVSRAIEVRGLKITVTKVPVPVAFGPAFEGETVRKGDMHVEFGGQRTPSFELVRMREAEAVEDG
ncbi:MAG: CO dehydrogenase/CO-methylating acetyl-CoA synthase complex subunit beta, partial [Bacillota bacterium]